MQIEFIIYDIHLNKYVFAYLFTYLSPGQLAKHLSKIYNESFRLPK